MPRFLFWNFRYDGGDKEELLASLVQDMAIDILILAEFKIDCGEMLRHLRDRGMSFSTPAVPHNRIEIFAGYPEDCFVNWARDEDRILLRRFKAPGYVEFLLGAVHLVSGTHHERSERMNEALPISRAIREAQREVGHARSIIVGGFNLNPFDDAMVYPEGFGAMMTKELLRNVASTPDKRLKHFYNPMWSRMGREVEDGVPGTYYWNASRPSNIYWNYLDQVLIGYDLLDGFTDDRFRILTSISVAGKERRLIRKKDIHWEIELSDHLPILFDVDLSQEA